MAASPFGDVLQCRAWGEVKKPDWQPILVDVRDRDGTLRATSLVLKRAIPRTRRCIFYVPRGPILDWGNRADSETAVRALKSAAKKHRAILIKIDPAVPASTRIESTLKSLGFAPSPDAVGGFGGTQPRCVMKLDISGSDEDVQARFHQKWRYNIRLAAKKGVTVQEECTRDDLKTFHDLYRVTASRDGFTGRPLAYFQKMWDVLVPAGLMKLFITRLENQPLSAAICLVLGDKCCYLYGASSNEHRNVMPNHAMQWAMMRWAKSLGCTIYDFRGVADEAQLRAAQERGDEGEANHLQGLNRFKAGFGAELIEYVGEWDLPLSKSWYWLWTSAFPKMRAAMKKARRSKV